MADIHLIRTPAETALAEAFASVRTVLPGTEEIRFRRDAAFNAVRREGLPHRRVEDWKYTDLRALMREVRPLAEVPDAKALDLARLPHPLMTGVAHLRLTLVDGSFAPSLSDLALLPVGMRVTSLADALGSGDIAFSERIGADALGNIALSLNAAFMTDGVVVTVDDGVTVDPLVHLQCIQTSAEGRAVHVRSVIVLGAGASLSVVDSYEGMAGAVNQTNAVIEATLGAGARLDRVAIQTESLESLHLATLVGRLGREATLESFALGAGSAVARSQVFLTYVGERAKATLRGTTLLAGRRHADTTLVVDHAVPGGESREVFKAVVDGLARSVFQGKIIVRPHAQKTDGRMMSQSILLSDEAEADNKPELEIFADDVQCGHGATCGALDDDLLFYCQARGIPDSEAKAILLQAFLGESIETIAHEGLREAIMTATQTWLANRV